MVQRIDIAVIGAEKVRVICFRKIHIYRYTFVSIYFIFVAISWVFNYRNQALTRKISQNGIPFLWNY